MPLALTPSTPAGGYGIREGSRTSGPRVRSTPVRPGPSALAAPPLSLRQDAGFFGRQQDIGPARPVYARPPWSLRPCRTAKRKPVLRLPTLPLRQALREQGSLGPRPASPLPSALCLSL